MDNGLNIILNENNRIIEESKKVILENYNKTVDSKPFDFNDSMSEDELSDIIEKQEEEINKLNIIIDTEGQSLDYKREQKIEKLRDSEPDKEFSEFYHNGIVVINNIEVSVDKFYIRLLEVDGELKNSFVCTDERIDPNIFNNLIDNGYKLKGLYKLKNSKVFYEMYLDKDLYTNNKIVLDTKEKEDKFRDYVNNKWTNETQKLVAETMYNK